jgi:MoaA/NifB/PqqE/SkfB family radical SAM enzyme
MITAEKMWKLGQAYLKSKVQTFPLWMHLWVTDNCNLDCDYCFVKNNSSRDPETEEVKQWIDHADNLGSAVVAFMGGEPTLRTDLVELINHAGSKSLMTYVTTNAKHKSFDTILLSLAKAGLDVLEVSLDGYDSVKGSEKTLGGNEDLIDLLDSARQEYGLRLKAHQVLAPENLGETLKLVELAEKRNLPISFGLVNAIDGSAYSNSRDRARLRQTVYMLIDKKKAGVPILNPIEYFTHAFAFLNSGTNWKCDVGKYVLQVATNGKVYVCSTVPLISEDKFLDIDRTYFEKDNSDREKLLTACKKTCYSACAFSTAFFRKNPEELIKLYKRESSITSQEV